MNVEKKIKRKAKDIGFDLVGITDLSPSIYKKEYKISIKKIKNSNLEYLHRTAKERLFPSEKFPWAKSVVVLGINYFQGIFPKEKNGTVRISRYAMVEDYHDVLSRRMTVLSRFIKNETKAKRIECYVDTGAVLEKELAERAGLGWIGKNTLLITEKFGSWIFLGEMFLDIGLESDEIKEKRCGECNICLKSCPSNALEDPYSLNIEKCVAFFTVKKKAKFPAWFPVKGNNYIFGCDICQEVCPFNVKTKITKTKEFLPSKNLINPSITYLANLSEEEFDSLFENTPVNWAGSEVFFRNIRAFIRN